MAAFSDASVKRSRHGTSPGPQRGQAKRKVENEASGAQLNIFTKAQEFFRICDVEGKGFITRDNMQRLHGELPLSSEELEKVFDTLDADGNGSLTPEEFTSGFSQFLFGQKLPVCDVHSCEPDNAPLSPWVGSCAEEEEEEEEDHQFLNLMEKLGANKVLEDENDVKKLWSKLRKDEPHLLSSFEEFLARVFSQLQEADHEKNELESALKKKIAAYDEEIKYLYEEMEQQIKNEKEKFLLKDTERFQSRSQELEHQLVGKEQELEQLAQKQKRLERECKELHDDKHETKVENSRLKLTNRELHKDVERTSQELIIAQQQLQMLQDEAKKLQEEKEIEVYRVTEALQREKSGLLKQLDFLRERNKYLKDERDVCLQKCRKSVPTTNRKQRSGSIIGKYVDTKVSFKSQSSEEDDTFSVLRRKDSFGVNGQMSLDSDSTTEVQLTTKKHLQRIISIEEDHLPQLLDRPGDRQLAKWPEEEEESVSPETEMSRIQMKTSSDPCAPRGQPVGTEALPNEKRTHSLPDRLFKIILVGNSSVGKTSFLKRFCEDRFSLGTAATVGVDYRVKTMAVDNSQVALQLWDTAGQERYQSMAKQFFRKADGIIVMYDITARNTFLAVKQWLVNIEEAAGENIPVLLLGNKTDHEKEREVPNGLGEHLAKDYNLIFYECSALSGHNIKESVTHLARILKEQEDKVKEKTVQLHEGSKRKPCCSRQ
ncbi:EF-hand calcium-binding domain-containing protein 4B [Heteronotia binoei]|uniref:EF-hand calcium-binding domain-containing protein 4B n=1 Tax=Heteronotia binoei TaxID=13085 RepID=UPI00292CB654|nr:EF-hand calcium-binding domain-containing protein 4B [Heteronotia binoei]